MNLESDGQGLLVDPILDDMPGDFPISRCLKQHRIIDVKRDWPGRIYIGSGKLKRFIVGITKRQINHTAGQVPFRAVDIWRKLPAFRTSNTFWFVHEEPRKFGLSRFVCLKLPPVVTVVSKFGDETKIGGNCVGGGGVVPVPVNIDGTNCRRPIHSRPAYNL